VIFLINSPEKLYTKVEPDFQILKDVNRIGTEQYDILYETQAELRYLKKELEAAKLLAAQTLDSYDEMKVHREYYQLLHSKAIKELNQTKKKLDKVHGNVDLEIAKVRKE